MAVTDQDLVPRVSFSGGALRIGMLSKFDKDRAVGRDARTLCNQAGPANLLERSAERRSPLSFFRLFRHDDLNSCNDGCRVSVLVLKSLCSFADGCNAPVDEIRVGMVEILQ
jgi:hypothetical protein